MVGVELSLVLEGGVDALGVLDQDLVAGLDAVVEGLVGVVERDHAEGVLEVHDQEAHRHVLVRRQLTHHLRRHNHVPVVARRQLCRGHDVVGNLLLLLLVCREADLSLEGLGHGLDHVDELVGLHLALLVNQSVSLDDEVDGWGRFGVP